MRPARNMPVATIRGAVLLSIVTTTESNPPVFCRAESLKRQSVAYLVALEDVVVWIWAQETCHSQNLRSR